MRKSPVRYLLLVLLLLVIGLVAWFWKVEQLPFQRADPLAAVGQSQPLLLTLPDSLAAHTPYPWQAALHHRNQLLDSLGLHTAIQWKNWWLLPVRGQDGEAIYTFIGEASTGLSAYWQPLNYGPTLPFGGGDIYTFAYTQEDEVFFARYRNLLLIGRYPFQVEAALRRLTTDTDNWAVLPAFQQLRADKPSSALEAALWLYPPALNVELPTGWLSAAAIRQWQPLEAIRLEFTNLKDSSATLRWAATTVANQPTATGLPWIVVPPEATTVFPVPNIIRNPAAGLTATWAVQLPVGPASEHNAEPNLWLTTLGDSARWVAQRTQAELIDYEDYQTYRLEQWRDFPLLGEWTGRRGVLQAWTLTLDEWVVTALEREVLERWLDLYLLGASLALDPQFERLSVNGDQTISLLSWSGEGEAPALLELLFPTAAWAKRGIGALQLEENVGEVLRGTSQLQVDERKPPGLRLRWTAPLPATSEIMLPLQLVGQQKALGVVLGQSGATAQVFTAAGLSARWALPEGHLLGPVYQLPGSESRYLLTTGRGVFQLGEAINSLTLPGTIGVAAAAAVQVQARGQDWEWLLLDQQGRIQLGQADGQLTTNWQLTGTTDSSSSSTVYWQRTATAEQIIVGGEGVPWQSYDKQGNLQWEVSSPITARVGEATGWDNPADPRMYVPLVDGKIQVLNRSGQHFKLTAGRGPVDHAVVGQWWGDARSDIVLQRGNLIHLFGYEGNDFGERWQYRMPVVPDTLLPAAELGILVAHTATQQLWLLNGEGKVSRGFPIAGSAQVQLVRDEQGQPVLLVVADDELYAYAVGD